jgi:hypothetical protein
MSDLSTEKLRERADLIIGTVLSLSVSANAYAKAMDIVLHQLNLTAAEAKLEAAREIRNRLRQLEKSKDEGEQM